MNNSRHPRDFPHGDRSKQYHLDDRSTFYGGQSFKSINDHSSFDTRKSGFNPNLQNTNVYSSHANVQNSYM